MPEGCSVKAKLPRSPSVMMRAHLIIILRLFRMMGSLLCLLSVLLLWPLP
jgi:hypothetical protein